MTIVIRPAGAADRQPIFELAKSLATTFEPTADGFATSFAELIVRDNALLVVAEEAAQILGYLLAHSYAGLVANGRVCWIAEVTVHADRRRQGIGRQLMQSCEAWARERNVKLVALATRRADAFYAALGYEASATYFRKIV